MSDLTGKILRLSNIYTICIASVGNMLEVNSMLCSLDTN